MNKMTKQKFNLSPKIYFILLLGLALVIITESVLIVTSLKKGVYLPSLTQKLTTGKEIKKGTMEIVLGENQKVTLNQNLKTSLVFDSLNEPVAGVDAIITFNPEIISVTGIVENKDLFGQIIINKQQQKQGRIKITAYQPKKVIQGKQTLATLTIRLLKNQPAVVGIEFLGPDRVTDSNLVSQTSQKDILSIAQPLKLTL